MEQSRTIRVPPVLGNVPQVSQTLAREVLAAARGGELPKTLLSFLRNPPPARWLAEELKWLRVRSTNDGKSVTIGTVSGPMAINPSDTGISRELAVYGVHEPVSTSLLREMVRPNMTVLDIGANLGYYVLLEAKSVGARGRVIAVEPSPKNLPFLWDTVELNSLHNITIIEGAISDHDGPHQLYLADESNWNALIFISGVHKRSIRVDGFKVDTLVSRLRLNQVDLLRMDIEGYEIHAMRGMRETLARHMPRLVVELHPTIVGGTEICRLLEFLESFGYQEGHVVERGLDFRWSEVACKAQVRTCSLGDLRKEEFLKRGERCVTILL